jgi:hypothetical protein
MGNDPEITREFPGKYAGNSTGKDAGNVTFNFKPAGGELHHPYR